MADEEKPDEKSYDPEEETERWPDIDEHGHHKQCFGCDMFYIGRHTGENPHKMVHNTSTGRCPDCQAKFDKRKDEAGLAQAMKEELEQTDSAHARRARYYANEPEEARNERLRKTEEREKAEREAEQARKDEESNR